MKPSIIFIILDKNYMPCSHWVAVCISEFGYAEYSYSYAWPSYKLEIMAFLQRHSIPWAFNRHTLQGITSNSAVTTAASTRSTEPGDIDDFLEHVFLLATPDTVKCSAYTPRSFWKVPLAAGLSRSSSNCSTSGYKGKFTHDYQSAISLLVIDFTFLEGRDGELVVKELVAFDSQINTVSYVFMRP